MGAARKKPTRNKPARKSAPVIVVRLNRPLSPQIQSDGSIAASVDGNFVNLGHLSPAAMERARGLTDGLSLAFLAGKSAIAREVDGLVRRLGRHGLLEYRLGFPGDAQAIAVIEPQVAEYWPQRVTLRESDTVVLSLERRETLVRALATLSPAPRQVVPCRYLLDLDEVESAAVLGWARGTVKSRLHRALARLRESLDADPQRAPAREAAHDD